MSSAVQGASFGALICVAAAPYLARLTLSVPDRDATRWWLGQRASSGRIGAVALVGLVLGALGGTAARWSALLPALVLLALAGAVLVVIDFEVHRLPDRVVLSAGVAGAGLFALAAAQYGDWHPYLRAVEGAAAVFAVLFVIFFVAPASFGLGDVKLGAVLGGYLGWFSWLDVYYGIFAGFLLGTIVGIGLMVTGKASRKTALPFGPMLILGTLIVLALHLSSRHLVI